MKKKNTIITIDMQLDIFEDILLRLIDIPSDRWRLMRMLESQDKVDNAELDLKLKKLELELLQKGGDDEHNHFFD